MREHHVHRRATVDSRAASSRGVAHQCRVRCPQHLSGDLLVVHDDRQVARQAHSTLPCAGVGAARAGEADTDARRVDTQVVAREPSRGLLGECTRAIERVHRFDG